MDPLNAVALARIQFGLNIAFHILFPTITIALAWILVYFRVRYARTGDGGWLATYQLWTKVFALSFAMGVVSGIVMSFQFGTNWPGYMNKVGNIAGPLLAYEVLTAFFLEATFLGVMLFGMNRVPGWMHLGATVLVAIGTTISAFWILALNSWMQTPLGHVVADGQIVAGDWWQVIFNPSFPYRLMHMMLASGLTASFLVAGLSAWRLLQAAEDVAAKKTLRAGVGIAAVLVPLQILIGDLHGLNTLEHQPAKIAAIEAIWKTAKGVPLVLLAIPNDEKHSNDFALEIPKGASLILKHDPDAELQGHRRLCAGHPAGGAGVLCVSSDGRYGRLDAAPFLDRGMEAAPGRTAAALALVGFRRVHLLRVGRDARRLARDRDRAPAVAGDRRAAHSGRRRGNLRGSARREPHRLCHHLWPDADRLHGGAHPSRRPRQRPGRAEARGGSGGAG